MNIQDVEKQIQSEMKQQPATIHAGETVKVYYKIKDREKERTHPIEGIVLKQQGMGMRKTFTIRRISFGSGMEITFPLYSPNIDKVEVLKAPKKTPRRARLYYLRQRIGKEATTA